MASPQAIAEGGSVVSADQINYEQKMYSHPSYVYNSMYPNTFGQPINLTTSQTPITINIPPQVFNWAETNVNYTVDLPAPDAGNYIWYASQPLKEISHIQFYSGNSMLIADIDNFQNYMDIVLKKELSMDEFLSLDPMTGLSQNNCPVNVIPALRNANYNGNNTLVTGFPSNPSSVNYMEPAYFNVGALNQPVTYNVQFPLKYIKNSIFSIDKNLYFGDITSLKIYFGPISKICYQSTSNANPSAAVKSAYDGDATVTNLQLMLAVETNQNLRQMTINKVETTGQTYYIPYVQTSKVSNVGSSQTVNVTLNQTNGRSLLKLYHALYNVQESLDTMYDHANNDTISGTPNSNRNQKIRQYYTQLNGTRIQNLTLDCTSTGPFTDYMQNKRQLRGSILSNLNVYQYNWFHCDDWSDFGPRYDQDNKGELISGIPMTIAPLTWSFVGISMRPNVNLSNNDNFQHYTWLVFIKKLIMAKGQTIVQ